MGNINWEKEILNVLKGEKKISPFALSSLRKWIINKDLLSYKCNRCNINKWEGSDLTLDLEHKDGNRKNNKLENLEFLCPNCHSQTSTFRGKNSKKKNNTPISPEQVIKLYGQGLNINEILERINFSNGGNYNTVYKILKNNNIVIPTKEDNFKLKKEIEAKKIENKIKLLQKRIDLIFNSNIDFNNKGWGKKVSQIINMTPSASLKFIYREMPEFSKKCWKHSDKK
jgi:transposase-like protein